MTIDAVGGVWRYALDAARALGRDGIDVVLVGFGPRPDAGKLQEAARLRHVQLVWTLAPLDWMVREETDLDGIGALLSTLAADFHADVLHLNLPSQAFGLAAGPPVVVVSHSCVATWWRAVRSGPLPPEWSWQQRRNRAGFDAADIVLAPSASHAAALVAAYGPIARLQIVPNALEPPRRRRGRREPFVFAAGRWWDEGKNARVLDEAAALSPWPVIMAGPCEGPNGAVIHLDHARTVGEMPGEVVRSVMARAAIFAAPSRYEPFGLAVLEAAATGAALLLSDIPTFREFWTGAALFAAADEPGEMADRIGALAGDPDLRSHLGRAARERAAAFSPERQGMALRQAYSTAMAATGPMLAMEA